MKYLVLLIALTSTLAFSKSDDLESFNKKLMSEIDEVMRDNAYKFQAEKRIENSRKPASVRPIMDNNDLHEKQEDHLAPKK